MAELVIFQKYSGEAQYSKMKDIDYIIIGQGLAGTLLAIFLLEQSQNILIIDNYREGGASKIAAGLVNPVTGRRIVKSWRIDEFLPFAKKTYQSIENQYAIKIWNEMNIIRTFKNAEDENEWLLRSSWADYQPFCKPFTTPTVDTSTAKIFSPTLKSFYGYGEILQAAQVDLNDLLSFFQAKWLNEGILIQEKFDYNALKTDEKGVLYKNYKAKKAIFCEGAAGVKNPFFNYLPFNLDKGELLIVKIPNLDLTTIFKNNISIVPLKIKNYYWVGATNEWNSAHDLPTDEKKQLIINELREILTVDFEVINHQAAFRPTVKDRRPLLGFHPNYPHLGIFNGLGTKGASLAPYWAAHFSSILLWGGDVEKDVNINRFQKL
jgi:glycine oxidase